MAFSALNATKLLLKNNSASTVLHRISILYPSCMNVKEILSTLFCDF
jgi:hypothetical protein